MLWSLVLGIGIARADHDSEAAHDPELLFRVIMPYGGSPTKAASRVTGVWVSSRPEADVGDMLRTSPTTPLWMTGLRQAT
jgi:hypothetical protein